MADQFPGAGYIWPCTEEKQSFEIQFTQAYLGYACFKKKYYRVCTARAAVNKIVCEDSHPEHVQFATAAVSTFFRSHSV